MVLWSSATTVGTLAAFLLLVPFFCNNWVYITEPRPINCTNENGEQLVGHARARAFGF